MPLPAGARLGPYEVLALLGAGGMGEVYKARDTRLDRIVAVKILPEALAADPQFRERFDREARAISRLTHPHICTLHDVGEHPSTDSGQTTAFLVMELLDGETLAARLERGALPLATALTVAIEVASALDAAHRAGIVHRDLKPGNIFLVRSGGASAPPIAKLLDFGLAKAGGPAIAGAGPSMLPTTPPNITVQGTILGTFQYMAPEQIEGLDADARTDIFAFGCVLFEMLTGKKAFEGKTQASLIGAILKDEPPPVSQVQPVAPASLNRIVATCLAKDPEDRWQSARDVMRELKWVAGGSALTDGAARVLSPAAPRSAWPRALVWATGAALVLAIAALMSWARFRTRLARADSSSRFLLSEQRPAPSETPNLARSFAISPDGRRVVYAGVSEGVRRLYLRDLQTLEAKPIVGTEGGSDPFFAPDGRRLGFWAESALKVIGIDGGSPITLVQGVQDRGATWAPDDTIIYSPLADKGLSRVPVTGGTPQIVAIPDATKHERTYRWPHMLPGGDAVLFTIGMSDIVSFDEARIAVRSLKTGEQHELLRGGSFASYVAPGYLLYARAGGLQAVRFNAAKTALEGSPTTVVDGITTYPTTGAAQYAVSSDGTLLYLRGGPDIGPTNALTWVDRAGRSAPLSLPPAAYQQVSLSPDGRFAALGTDGANSNIWILEFSRSTLTRLTLESSNHTPAWTPDGARVAFVSARAGGQSLYWQSTEGHTDQEPLTPGRVAWRGAFSPDGRTLAFEELSPDTGFDVWIMSMDGNRVARPFVRTKFDEDTPRFSPDGRWLAYVSNETGASEVYAQPFPGPGRRVRVSTEGGMAPIWSRDGRELFYRKGTELIAVKVSSTAVDLAPQRPEVLFRKTASDEYDVASDGRFLMMEPVEARDASAPIVIVLNWIEELKARLPAR